MVLVDDGLATDATMHAAIRALHKGAPRSIVVATPIASPEAYSALSDEVDEVVCALAPQPFESTGPLYEDRSETTEDEVRDLLAAAWRSEPDRMHKPIGLRRELTSSNKR